MSRCKSLTMLLPIVLALTACGQAPEPVANSKATDTTTSAPASVPVTNASAGAIVITAQAGAVDGYAVNSDEFLWQLFTEFAAPAQAGVPAPVVFETWASDADTFSTTPTWPAPGAAKKFQASVLGGANAQTHGAIDVPCVQPPNGALGGFPTSGTPTPCIAEEVKRNKPQFDYIVGNNLNTQAGLAAAYANNVDVQMPLSAISIKGDWIKVPTLIAWIPGLDNVETVREYYYTYVENGDTGPVEYALVSLHISSRQNANWVWGSLEHELNPGRCDDLGCYDTFGAVEPVVLPNRFQVNSQYGSCDKSAALQLLMSNAQLSPVWQNYCMKSTQVDYSAADGTPYALGNSVIERITGNGTVVASSCIACHVYASFGSDGAPTKAATAMLPFNPTGEPIPAVLDGALKFDFMWGVVHAPAGGSVQKPWSQSKN